MPDKQANTRAVIGTCEHGWPGDSCGQAHPYMAEPTRIGEKGMTSTNGSQAGDLADQAALQGQPPWPEELGGKIVCGNCGIPISNHGPTMASCGEWFNQVGNAPHSCPYS